MSMLHAPVEEESKRQGWWIYGACNHANHPFAEESRSLLKQIPRGRSYTLHSRPATTDRMATDFEAQGHIDVAVLQETGIPRKADFYLCGPSSFLKNMRDGFKTGAWLPS
jgi:ferredoxin-NADP reductase